MSKQPKISINLSGRETALICLTLKMAVSCFHEERQTILNIQEQIKKRLIKLGLSKEEIKKLLE
ncbi:MAG: hypothetical protein ABFD75_11300 [Smithella sp.]